MASQYKSSLHQSISISVSPLTQQSFAPFGSVIENPRTVSSTVNQGTAAKYPQISPFVSYPTPSHKHGYANMNMFVCQPRQLENGNFPVKILERHPYTTQTFIPIGLDKSDSRRKYLVIVAPTLGPAPDNAPQDNTWSEKESKPSKSGGLWRPPPFPLKLLKKTKISAPGSRPPPFPLPKNIATDAASQPVSRSTGSDISGTVKMKGKGLPDLNNLKAFICNGSQAVTYGVGTWHAPMVVLGEGEIEFVVVMHENGVDHEDCEECEIEGGKVKILLEDGPVKAKL